MKRLEGKISKKTYAVIMTLTLTVGMLAGCGKKAEPVQNNQEAVEPVQNEQEVIEAVQDDE